MEQNDFSCKDQPRHSESAENNEYDSSEINHETMLNPQDKNSETISCTRVIDATLIASNSPDAAAVNATNKIEQYSSEHASGDASSATPTSRETEQCTISQGKLVFIY